MMQELDTPSIIVDQALMNRNIQKIAKLAAEFGVAVRPHTKTHKIPEIARLQIEAGARGITVAKLSEAEVMANSGIRDIFVAYPIVSPMKLDRLVELNAKINLIAGVDSLEGALRMSERAVRHNTTIKVRLEIDTGLGRTGVLYSGAVELADRINLMEGLQFCGIYTFRGNLMNGKPTMDVEEAGLEEGRLMVELAEQMRTQGIEVRDVSVGSTPTAAYAAQVMGVTEVRPGTYVFYDRMQAVLQACRLEECAAVVRVTIVSRPVPDRIIIDGGSKTFATDVAPGVMPLNLKGYGHVLEAPHAVIERLSEEHGIVRIHEADRYQIGDVLHIIPNHICSTVNLHNYIYMKDNGQYRKVKVEGRGMLT
jgi:D-serine deaminase-like pyridoxal phosphate-dependent protein